MPATLSVLLLASAAATAVGAVTLHHVRGLRRQIVDLRDELARDRAVGARPATVPAARTTPDTDAIREAVADALAEERERELAEARAFWAAQEARDGSDLPPFLAGGALGEELFMPRQADFAGLEPVVEPVLEPSLESEDEFADESPELAAARRRHPSHPDFVPVQAEVSGIAGGVGDHERTVACLEELAQARTALADVRPGPLGTLDVYVFADGTTLCMTPGHRETAEQLAAALRAGDTPVLLGGSGISGAYALTFECGSGSVYILADRVIASA
ncbi:hypothetical protein GTY65_34430 [Streptomyces sp. SID8379]|uniref:hypothetical protein n=1 Tax=unclassified Streptomyces TaxID=2593676 RepID=UPI00035C8C8F|nr:MULTISPECIES: hypothetical protein [unclassified Streptomyces]MYW69134.1 hypothetical protein [Streptomyces sp. SID8379]